jgi:hypothetical protein
VGAWGSQEVCGHAIRGGRRSTRVLMWRLAITVGTLVAGAITIVAVLTVKLRKYKVKRHLLTPGRKALITEAYELHRSHTPKSEAITRLRIMSNGDRSELWAASTRVQTPLRDNHEAVAVKLILVEAARPYSEGHRIPDSAWKLPEPSSEEQRLRRLPHETAFAELLDLEPRLSEALAVARTMAGEVQTVPRRISVSKREAKALTAKQRAETKRLVSVVRPILGAKSHATLPLLQTNTAAAIAVMHLMDIAQVNNDYWTR